MNLRTRRPLLVIVAITAAIAAAATAGAVFGFGIRAGTPVRGFNVIASLALGDRAHGIWGYQGAVTLTGMGLHLTAMSGCGVLFALIAVRMHGWRLAAMAGGTGLFVWLVTIALLQRRVGPGVGAVLGPGQVAGLHLVLAVALAVGMRFARSAVWSDPQGRAAPQDSP